MGLGSELLGTAIEVAEAVGERSVIPQSRWELAHLELVRGDLYARREFAAAITVAEEIGDVESAVYAELGLAELDTAEGDTDAAQSGTRMRALAALMPDRHHARDRRAGGARTRRRAALRRAAAGPHRSRPRPAGRSRRCSMCRDRAWPGDGAAPLRCVVPFRFSVHPRMEERLRWYVEEYASRPIDPAPAIAAEVETELEQLGEALPRRAPRAPRVGRDRRAPARLYSTVRVELVADALSADTLPWSCSGIRRPVRAWHSTRER